MAERRMFAKSIVLSDAFLDMPMSARCLYFTLGMLADDDGFVGSPKAIMRQCGSSVDDMNILLAKRYVLGFESGVIVIKHWRMNNYLQNDRHKPTTYLEELSTLEIDEKGAYTEGSGQCIQNVYKVDTQVSIGKDSKGKNSKDNTSYIAPSSNESEAVARLPLNENGTFHYVLPSDVEHYRELYPGVDVEQELRNMTGWLEANRERRKTKRGVQKFINNWLSKAQNRAKGSPQKKGDLFYFDVD